MDNVSIANYIKTTNAEMICSPVKYGYTNAVGFVLTPENFIIAFTDRSGKLCKLVHPVDLSKFSGSDISRMIQKLPVVSGFNDKDNERLLRILQHSQTVTPDEHLDIIKSLRTELKKLSDDNSNYKILYDSANNQMVTVKHEYEQKVRDLQQQLQLNKSKIDQMEDKLVSNSDEAIAAMKKYKDEMKEYIQSKDLELSEVRNLHNQMSNENKNLNAKLNALLEAKRQELDDAKANDMSSIISDYTVKIEQGDQKISELEKTIDSLQGELRNTQNELNLADMERRWLQSQQSKCQQQILNDKDKIIQRIKEYNDEWLNWYSTIDEDVTLYKRRIVAELETLQRSLGVVLQNTVNGGEESRRLKQSISDIEIELKRVISEQLVMLNAKEEQIQSLQDQVSQKEDQLVDLREQLQKVKSLLVQNDATNVQSTVDYDNCYSILQNFFALNNMFYRKLEVVKILGGILQNNSNDFDKLPEQVRQRIQSEFSDVELQIKRHIDFLDLKRFVNSPNLQYLKSKATRDKVPPSFCDQLVNLIEYWNENKATFREQDRRLTNMYEDLSGAVRVYVRIKPLKGIDQQQPRVSIGVTDNQKQKTVVLNCTGVPDAKYSSSRTFGDFYGVFPDGYTNLDVYTGVDGSTVNESEPLVVDTDGIVESSDSVSPGLYSVFRQVEDGYSVVIFGYGLSGSGKSFTLLGSEGVPGLMHYGLTNLRDVTNIKLKYLFEQYVSSLDLNFSKIRGKIHNLVREVPQMRKVSKDEGDMFKKYLTVNVDNIKVSELSSLTQSIDKYRIEQARIKRTPNNPVSSRSHLYFVFEITFESGAKGYVTFVDTAGRESPIDLYNTFINTSKAQLNSIMAPSGGVQLVAKAIKSGLDYNAEEVYNLLKEGFYINETINHLIYYFNSKNYKKTKVVLQPSDTSKYSVGKYFVKPFEEENNVNETNNCLTIPIMTFLDTLTNKNKSDSEWKPTKFVMMCMVRQEEKYCDQIYETLDFAHNIKSS